MSVKTPGFSLTLNSTDNHQHVSKVQCRKAWKVNVVPQTESQPVLRVSIYMSVLNILSNAW